MGLPFKLFKLLQIKSQALAPKTSISKDMENLSIVEDRIVQSLSENEIALKIKTDCLNESLMKFPDSDNTNVNVKREFEPEECKSPPPKIGNNIIQSEKQDNSKEIVLRYCLNEIENFDDAIHQLNIEGEKQVLQFKKGIIKSYDNGK